MVPLVLNHGQLVSLKRLPVGAMLGGCSSSERGICEKVPAKPIMCHASGRKAMLPPAHMVSDGPEPFFAKGKCSSKMVERAPGHACLVKDVVSLIKKTQARSGLVQLTHCKV